MSNENILQREENKTFIEKMREKFSKIETILRELWIGHENEIRMLLISLVAREHAVMIGSPGTAKSYVIHNLAKLVNGKFYFYLLTKFTTDIELLGAFNVRELMLTGRYRRMWSNIVNADLVFLDEIFKANSAILNALLTIMNERIVSDPYSGEIIHCRTWTVYGASNELPEDEELKAFYDRFVIRMFIDDRNDPLFLQSVVQSYWRNKNRKLEPIIDMSEIHRLNKFCEELITTEIAQDITLLDIYCKEHLPLLKELRDRGLQISTRTIAQKIPKLISAYCIIYGITGNNIVNAFYDILPFLASNKDDLKTINSFINEMFREISDFNEKLKEAKVRLRQGQISDVISICQEILNYDLSKLASKPLVKAKMELILKEAKILLEKAMKIKEQLENI